MNQPGDHREAGGAIRCAAFRRALKRLERRKRLSSDAEQALLVELREHGESCHRCHVRFGARLNAIDALCGLGGREIPDGILDDLYDSIRQRVPLTPTGGGMTLAFLDAPRQLRMWRTAALAASFVLAVGTGFVATGGLSFSTGATGPRERPLHDPREHLLQQVIDRPGEGQSDGLRLRPLPEAVRRGRSDFFRDPGAEPVDYERSWK